MKQARYLVLRLLTYRARSKKEVLDYLEKKKFSINVSKAIIKEMEDYGYIDDQRFVKDYINYRKQRGYGLNRVRYELRMKGVADGIIEKWLDKEFDPNEDLERIKVILSKRAARDKDISGEEGERRLQRDAAFLKRRGFQDHLILSALKKYDLSE